MNNKKILLDGDYEQIIEIDNHFYIVNKKDKICVLPYTLDSKSLLDKIGIIEEYDKMEEENILTLISDYVKDDDETNLVAANRLLFEICGINIMDANKWMYLGNLDNSLTSDSPIKLYTVNITDISIKTDEEVEEKEQRRKFRMMDSSRVLQTDDILFLAGFFRLFQFCYTIANK